MNGFLNDVIFKIVFGTQQNERFLRSLVNAVLGLSGLDKIEELVLLSPNLDKDYWLQRGAILDVRARDGRGQHYNIEIQVRSETDYIKRSLYYLSRMYGQQLDQGEDYSKLSRCVGISILDFQLFTHTTDLHSVFRFYDTRHQHQLTDALEMHYLELTKFLLKTPGEARTPLEKWLYVLKFGEMFTLQHEPIPLELKEDEDISMAIEEMRKAYATDEVKVMMEERLKALRDYNSGIANALAEGEERGEAKGQAKAQLEMAKKLEAKGMDDASILEVTGVNLESV